MCLARKSLFYILENAMNFKVWFALRMGHTKFIISTKNDRWFASWLADASICSRCRQTIRSLTYSKTGVHFGRQSKLAWKEDESNWDCMKWFKRVSVYNGIHPNKSSCLWQKKSGKHTTNAFGFERIGRKLFRHRNVTSACMRMSMAQNISLKSL